MDTFRLTLIFVGLAVLFIIYLLETARRRKLREKRNNHDQPPSLDGGPFPDGLGDDQPHLGLRSQHPALQGGDQPAAPPIGAGLLQEPMSAAPPSVPPANAVPAPDADMSAAWQQNQQGAVPQPPPAAAPAAAADNPFLKPEDLEPVPPASSMDAGSHSGPAADPASEFTSGPTSELAAEAVAEPAAEPIREQAPHPAANESDEVPEPPEGFSDLIIALQVSAPEGSSFSGRDIQGALRRCELEYGEMKIYHYFTPQRRSLFFLANSVEPGSFDLTTMASISTPGVVFFLRLPTVLAGLEAFEIMLDVAGRVTEQLGGKLQDQQGNALGKHELTGIRERIAAYEYKLKAHERQMAML